MIQELSTITGFQLIIFLNMPASQVSLICVLAPAHLAE